MWCFCYCFKLYYKNMNLRTKAILFLLGSIFSFTSVSAVGPSITVTSPNGGEIWGGTHDITWTSVGGSGFVNIFRCTTSDCSATTSIQMNAPDTGSTTWNTSGLNENNKIYIEDAADSTVFDVSDANFTLDNSISSCNASIASNNSSTTLAKVGDVVTVLFDTCETISASTVIIAGHAVNAYNAGGTTYGATTSMLIGDNEGDISFSASYTDFGGNTFTRSTTANSSFVTFDKTIPTVSISMATTTLKAGDTSTTTFTFSETVTGFSNTDITTIDSGSLSPVASLDGGITWTALFIPTVDTTATTSLITIDTVGVLDLAGNAGTSTASSVNYVIDTLLPTVNILLTDTALTVGETSLVTFTFSEPVINFNNSDLTTISNGTLTTATTTDGGITWTSTFIPTASVSSATNVITVGTSWSDVTGNSPATTTNSLNYTINTVVVVSSSGGGGGGWFVYAPPVVVQPTPIISATTNLITQPVAEVSSQSTSIATLSSGQVLGVSSFNFLKNLRLKSTGNDVTELQKFLTREGFFKGDTTKYFGILTRGALIKWQTKNKLPATGYFGPMSRAVINNNS